MVWTTGWPCSSAGGCTVPIASVLTSAHTPRPTSGTIAPSTLTCWRAGPGAGAGASRSRASTAAVCTAT